MFYLFLFAHLVADFMLQPFWLVVRKRRWDGLLIHGSLVALCMLLLGLFEPAVLRYWPLMGLITAIHIATDWWKVHRADRHFKPPIIPFLMDQGMHVVTLAIVLSMAMPFAQVWQLSASPVARLALAGSVFVIAAFATPIGVMVWLDPQFSQASLALGARIRGLCVGVVVVILAWIAGPIALPATLVLIALLLRHPASAHPLDSTSGTLAVFLVAATLGTGLALLG